MAPPRQSLSARFWKYVVPAALDKCWEWQGGDVTKQGYGMLVLEPRVSKKRVYAHRLSFFLHNGYWPVVVRHSCDNPPCCNPGHLLAGTKRDNTRDMMVRGRGKGQFVAKHP